MSKRTQALMESNSGVIDRWDLGAGRDRRGPRRGTGPCLQHRADLLDQLLVAPRPASPAAGDRTPAARQSLTRKTRTRSNARICHVSHTIVSGYGRFVAGLTRPSVSRASAAPSPYPLPWEGHPVKANVAAVPQATHLLTMLAFAQCFPTRR